MLKWISFFKPIYSSLWLVVNKLNAAFKCFLSVKSKKIHEMLWQLPSLVFVAIREPMIDLLLIALPVRCCRPQTCLRMLTLGAANLDFGGRRWWGFFWLSETSEGVPVEMFHLLLWPPNLNGTHCETESEMFSLQLLLYLSRWLPLLLAKFQVRFWVRGN